MNIKAIIIKTLGTSIFWLLQSIIDKLIVEIVKKQDPLKTAKIILDIVRTLDDNVIDKIKKTMPETAKQLEDNFCEVAEEIKRIVKDK